MKVKFKRTTNNFEKLLKKIERLSKSNVESGYFSEQGDHPYAEMSYATLMFIHEKGEGNFPERPVRGITLFKMGGSEFSRTVKSNLSDYFYKDKNLNSVLNNFGIQITQEAVSIFGDNTILAPNSNMWADLKGDDTPLVLDGYLRDAWSWKTSEDKSLKSLGGI